jgi:transcriptional regulator with XRE-family HTH domain
MNMTSQQTRHRRGTNGHGLNGQSTKGHGKKAGGAKGGARPSSAAPRSTSRKSPEAAGVPLNGAVIGGKLRAERERQGITVREMARRVDVSPSLVSQIERGLVRPSVGTLWSMTTQLGLAMDGLFTCTERGASATEQAPDISRIGNAVPIRHASAVVQRGHNRQHIRLAGGVAWERLTAAPDGQVEFLHVRYEAGAESCPENSFFRHGGREYAYVLDGRLGLQIGFDRYELSPGDSVSFESHNPHRLWAIGDRPATAIWVIIDRTNDSRN